MNTKTALSALIAAGIIISTGQAGFNLNTANAALNDLKSDLKSEEITNTVPPTGVMSDPVTPNNTQDTTREVSTSDVKKAQDLINNSGVVQISKDGSEQSSEIAITKVDMLGILSVDLESINIRSGPWGNVIGKLFGGKLIKITGDEGDWYVIDYNGQKGYVLKSNLTTTNKDFKSNFKESGSKKAKVINCENLGLNVRGSAWGEKIGGLPNGADITVIGEDGDWYKIEYDGKIGYVYKNYVSMGSETSKSEAKAEPQTESKTETANNTPNSTKTQPEAKTNTESVTANTKTDDSKTTQDTSSNSTFKPSFSDGKLLKVPVRSQRDEANGPNRDGFCGPTSLGMALEYYGVNISTLELSKTCKYQKGQGTAAANILSAAKKSGFEGSYMREHAIVEDLAAITTQGKPVIVNVNTSGYWESGHYMVVTGVKDGKVYLNDPWIGKERSYTLTEFYAQWGTRDNRMIVIEK